MRRRLTVCAGVLLAVGAALLPAIPSGAVTTMRVTGEASCNAATGQHEITWTVTNVYPTPVTITIISALMTPPGSQLVGQLSSTVLDQGESATANATLPGSTTGTVTFAVDVTHSSSGVDSKTGTVELSEPCEAAAALLQVGPGAIVPGEIATISGTGCSSGTVTGSIAFNPALTFGPVSVAADGAWSTTVVVPSGTPAGNYVVSATCALPAQPGLVAQATPNLLAQGAPGFAYPTQYLMVGVSAAASGLTG